MRRNIAWVAAFALATSTFTAAASAEKPVELTPAQLASVQSKTYSVPSSVAFSAAVSTLQTLGYTDINASKDAGTISGVTEGKSKLIYNIFWGFGKKKMMQKASLLIEDAGADRSSVRLNFHVSETKARVAWGGSFSDGKLVKVGQPYTDFYAALDAEVARRSGVAAPSASSEPTAQVAAAAPAAN